MTKAEQTRQTILQKAFELIYKNGYQPTSIDAIIAATQVTKGAFFYHFRNKEEMGLALINEVILPFGMQETFVRSLQNASDPVNDIFALMTHLLSENPFFQPEYGCPVVNLAGELPAVTDTLAQAIHRVMNQGRQAMQANVERGKQAGRIRAGVDAEQVATFVMAGYGGIRNMGKIFGPGCYQTYLAELKGYLNTLR